MEIEHRKFLDEHIGNWHTVQNGYVRNIDLDILKMYEHIYRKYMSADFILTVWCGNCIFDMIKRLTLGMSSNLKKQNENTLYNICK